MVIQEMTRGEDRMTRQDRGLKEELGDQTDHFPGGGGPNSCPGYLCGQDTRGGERGGGGGGEEERR